MKVGDIVECQYKDQTGGIGVVTEVRGKQSGGFAWHCVRWISNPIYSMGQSSSWSKLSSNKVIGHVQEENEGESAAKVSLPKRGLQKEGRRPRGGHSTVRKPKGPTEAPEHL